MREYAALRGDGPTGHALCLHCGARVNGLPLGAEAICEGCHALRSGRERLACGACHRLVGHAANCEFGSSEDPRGDGPTGSDR